MGQFCDSQCKVTRRWMIPLTQRSESAHTAHVSVEIDRNLPAFGASFLVAARRLVKRLYTWSAQDSGRYERTLHITV